MSAFLAPELWPFLLATGLMIALAAMEAVALLIGMSTMTWYDGAGIDPDGFVGETLGWLHFGKVPVLVLLVIFLTTFAFAGFVAQFAVRGVTGFFVPWPLAAGVAFVVGVSGVRVFGGVLGRIVPRDETSAVTDASLVGRVGTIVIGTARAGRPAQVRVRDERGTSHYVMVEPEQADQVFETGSSVLLVRHVSGRRFHAIHNPKPGLL